MQFYDLFNNYKNSLKEIKGTIPFMRLPIHTKYL